MSERTCRFAVAVSRSARLDQALDEVLADLRKQLGDSRANLAMLFVTSHHVGDSLQTELARLRRELGGPNLIGAVAESVIGGDREIEQEVGLSVWCGCLPGETIVPLRMEF